MIYIIFSMKSIMFSMKSIMFNMKSHLGFLPRTASPLTPR